MKKYLKFAVMAAFALVTAYNVHKVQTEVVLSDTQLKNVEALANNEFWTGIHYNALAEKMNTYISQFEESAEYLKLALIYDSEINDWENMYFSQKELAKLYSRFDETSSIGYYKQALNSAKKLNDIFKEALVHFEMGDFFYEKGEDEKALVNFYNAKLILQNTSDSENIARIESRIKDIKMRVDSATFNLISQKYDKE